MDGGQYGAAFTVQPVMGVGVTQLLNGVAHDMGIVHNGRGGDFSRNQRQPCGQQAFAGNPPSGVPGQDCIQNGV